jgi:hypothetical protein
MTTTVPSPRSAAARAVMLAALLAMPSPGLAAGPAVALRSCSQVKDPGHLQALAVARAWHEARWAPLAAGQPARRGWITSYVIPAPPPAPLGIATFARAQDLGADKDVPTTPIAGFAYAAKLLCTTRPPAADGTILVQFLGLGLRFQEGAGSWSKPMRRPALLHALVLSRAAPDAAWAISEEPEAPTVLIPGSRLSPPSAADISAALAATVPTTTVKLRR